MLYEKFSHNSMHSQLAMENCDVTVVSVFKILSMGRGLSELGANFEKNSNMTTNLSVLIKPAGSPCLSTYSSVHSVHARFISRAVQRSKQIENTVGRWLDWFGF